MSTKLAIRQAKSRDITTAARSLGRAFVDEPFTRHTVDSRDHANRVSYLQRLFLTEIGMRCGRVWVSDDAAAVAIWITPSSTGLKDAYSSIAGRVEDLRGDRAGAAARAYEAISALKPSEPVWILATVGVDPASQGQGLGRAVLEPGLLEAREQGIPAYVETSSNISFYERLGFVVTGSIELPDDGPTVSALLRKAPHAEQVMSSSGMVPSTR